MARPNQRLWSNYDPHILQKQDIYIASETGHLQVVRDLFLSGVDICTVDNFGRTPLHIAAYCGHLNIVKFLSTFFNNLESYGHVGWTPIHGAALNGKYDVVEFLLEKGVHVKLRDKHSRTPLHGAALNGHQKIVELLISKGSCVDSWDNASRTPLHYAASKGHVDVVKILINKGNMFTINLKDDTGATPLHKATEHQHFEVVKYLLENGADRYAIDLNGRNPLYYVVDDNIVDLFNSENLKQVSNMPTYIRINQISEIINKMKPIKQEKLKVEINNYEQLKSMECLNGNDPKINCYVCLVPLKLSLQYARKKNHHLVIRLDPKYRFNI